MIEVIPPRMVLGNFLQFTMRFLTNHTKSPWIRIMFFYIDCARGARLHRVRKLANKYLWTSSHKSFWWYFSVTLLNRAEWNCRRILLLKIQFSLLTTIFPITQLFHLIIIHFQTEGVLKGTLQSILNGWALVILQTVRSTGPRSTNKNSYSNPLHWCSHWELYA